MSQMFTMLPNGVVKSMAIIQRFCIQCVLVGVCVLFFTQLSCLFAADTTIVNNPIGSHVNGDLTQLSCLFPTETTILNNPIGNHVNVELAVLSGVGDHEDVMYPNIEAKCPIIQDVLPFAIENIVIDSNGVQENRHAGTIVGRLTEMYTIKKSYTITISLQNGSYHFDIVDQFGTSQSNMISADVVPKLILPVNAIYTFINTVAAHPFQLMKGSVGVTTLQENESYRLILNANDRQGIAAFSFHSTADTAIASTLDVVRQPSYDPNGFVIQDGSEWVVVENGVVKTAASVPSDQGSVHFSVAFDNGQGHAYTKKLALPLLKIDRDNDGVSDHLDDFPDNALYATKVETTENGNSVVQRLNAAGELVERHVTTVSGNLITVAVFNPENTVLRTHQKREITDIASLNGGVLTVEIDRDNNNDIVAVSEVIVESNGDVHTTTRQANGEVLERKSEYIRNGEFITKYLNENCMMISAKTVEKTAEGITLNTYMIMDITGTKTVEVIEEYFNLDGSVLTRRSDTERRLLSSTLETYSAGDVLMTHKDKNENITGYTEIITYSDGTKETRTKDAAGNITRVSAEMFDETGAIIKLEKDAYGNTVSLVEEVLLEDGKKVTTVVDNSGVTQSQTIVIPGGLDFTTINSIDLLTQDTTTATGNVVTTNAEEFPRELLLTAIDITKEDNDDIWDLFVALGFVDNNNNLAINELPELSSLFDLLDSQLADGTVGARFAARTAGPGFLVQGLQTFEKEQSLQFITETVADILTLPQFCQTNYYSNLELESQGETVLPSGRIWGRGCNTDAVKAVLPTNQKKENMKELLTTIYPELQQVTNKIVSNRETEVILHASGQVEILKGNLVADDIAASFKLSGGDLTIKEGVSTLQIKESFTLGEQGHVIMDEMQRIEVDHMVIEGGQLTVRQNPARVAAALDVTENRSLKLISADTLYGELDTLILPEAPEQYYWDTVELYSTGIVRLSLLQSVIETEQAQKPLLVYPSPLKKGQALDIGFGMKEEGGAVSIYILDILGRMQYQGSIAISSVGYYRHTIPSYELKHLSSGAYTLLIVKEGRIVAKTTWGLLP